MTAPPTPTPAQIPDRVAVAAHRALHTQWEWSGQSAPAAGYGCAECLPDIRTVLAPIWADLLTLAARPEQPPASDHPDYTRLLIEGSIHLHTGWPGDHPLEPGTYCTDCRDDVDVICDGIWALLRTGTQR